MFIFAFLILLAFYTAIAAAIIYFILLFLFKITKGKVFITKRNRLITAILIALPFGIWALATF
jgi:hypothetical protein